jgi:hypothetical protein
LEEPLLDGTESSERGPGGIDPELPAKTYFKRANSIPLLTRAEEAELIGRWQRFQDVKARNRVVEAHLRIPPAMARLIARKHGVPNKNIMTVDAVTTAWKGHFALVDELTAEGNLALVECVDQRDLSSPRMPKRASVMRSGSGCDRLAASFIGPRASRLRPTSISTPRSPTCSRRKITAGVRPRP